ncbi:MAG: DUF881 domain-containing protein [Clostridium sp.]|nr:DUF881 domain-containing protein [Clostridium sp.]
MKTNEATIFVFIACIIIGILISTSMNFKKVNNEVFLTPAEYQEAYESTSKLNKDIKALSEKYYQYYSKLQNYKENPNNKGNVLSEINKELYDNEMALGYIDIEGEGIEIHLDDATSQSQGEVVDPNEWWAQTVHDNDIVILINELKIAGAEAISLNGHRVTDRSNILCWGVFIEVDGVKIPAPFEIKAIGNKEKLYSYMVADGGYASFLKIRGNINVSVSKKDNVRILANDRKIDYKYVKEIKSKKTK